MLSPTLPQLSAADSRSVRRPWPRVRDTSGEIYGTRLVLVPRASESREENDLIGEPERYCAMDVRGCSVCTSNPVPF